MRHHLDGTRSTTMDLDQGLEMSSTQSVDNITRPCQVINYNFPLVSVEEVIILLFLHYLE